MSKVSTRNTTNIRSTSQGPDFFIVGATKAGTTSLYYYLNSHPEVYMSPVKEPHHFATDIDLEHLRPQVKKRLKAQETEKFIEGEMEGTLHRAYIRSRELYLKLFRKAEAGQIKGEASPSNLFSKTAAKEIHDFNSNAKILIILRNPVMRAYSHYLMDLKLGFTSLGFNDALKEDEKTTYKSWGAASNYIPLGMYFEQIKRYYAVFPEHQIKVILQEDLKRQPEKTMQQIYRFLNINESYLPNFHQKHNEALVPRNPITSRLLKIEFLRIFLREKLENSTLKRKIKNLLFTQPVSSSPDTATTERLKHLFKSDIEKTSTLIKHDLSEWL